MSGKRCKASYTVETSFIMAIVLSVMVFLIQFAYQQCRQTSGNMCLQETAETLHHRETIPGDSLALDTAPYQIEAERRTSRVSDHVEGRNWNFNIGSDIYEPGEFICLLTLVQE